MQKEIIGDSTLYHADCFDIIPTLDKVDAILTDPPYDLSNSDPGVNYSGMSLGKFNTQNYKNIINGFDHERLFLLLESICLPFNMFCFCSNKQISKLMTYHEAKGRSTTLLVWNKTNAAPFANGVWSGDIEYCIHTKDSGATFQGNAKEKHKVSRYPLVRDDDHPTVKPLALIMKYVAICSNEGNTILDPYLGSGTTGIACVKMGRRFIGIEKEERYFQLACRRIEEAWRQGDLFIKTPY